MQARPEVEQSMGSPVQIPLEQASSSVQMLPSSQGRPSLAGVRMLQLGATPLVSQVATLQALPEVEQSIGSPAQTPPKQASSRVQTLPSSHGSPSATGVRMSQLGPVPLVSQEAVLQALPEVEQSMGSPAQTPSKHTSSMVQGLPSLQGEPSFDGVRISQLGSAPLVAQDAVLQASPEVEQSTGSPRQTPPKQASSRVQTLPSSQGTPSGRGVMRSQLPSGPFESQAATVQASPAAEQSTGTPAHAPLEQTSLMVQGAPSSQGAPLLHTSWRS